MGMWTLNRALRIEKGTSSCTKSIGGRDIDTLMIISVAPLKFDSLEAAEEFLERNGIEYKGK